MKMQLLKWAVPKFVFEAIKYVDSDSRIPFHCAQRNEPMKKIKGIFSNE